MRKIATYLSLVWLLTYPSEALGQNKPKPEAREFGSVWIWSAPEVPGDATAVLIGHIEVDEVSQQASVTETKVYFESPRFNRAEITFRYNPETAGFGLLFRDSTSGWRAGIEGGLILDDAGRLPISQAKWSELIPLLQETDFPGLAFLKVDLSNGIDITAEHAPTNDSSQEQLLRDSLDAWISELSPDELLQNWDFPESTLEMLEFLSIPQAEPLREQISLMAPLAATVLAARGELERRQSQLLDQTPDAVEPTRGAAYREREWKVTEGRLDGELADRAGARTMIDQIRTELETSE